MHNYWSSGSYRLLYCSWPIYDYKQNWCQIRQAFPLLPSSLCIPLSRGLFISQVLKMRSLIFRGRHRPNDVVDQNTMLPVFMVHVFSLPSFELITGRTVAAGEMFRLWCEAMLWCADVLISCTYTENDPVFSDNDVSCSGHPAIFVLVF